MDDSLRVRKKRERRDAILDAFATALENRGIESISMDEIALAVDTSRATIFNYFSTKTEIVFSIADREIELLESFVAASANVTALDLIKEVMYRLVSTTFANPRVGWRVLKTVLNDPTRTDSPVRRLGRSLERLIRDGQATGELRNTLDVSSCARSILGTFLAELFSHAADPGSNRTISRDEFESVANQLVMQWSAPEAVGR